MKKLLVASAFALFGLTNAQTTSPAPIAKGTTYLSGTLNFAASEDNNTNVKTNDLTLVPTVGFFVADNFAVGLGVGYASSVTKNESTPITAKNTISAFVVEPFARKYWTLGEKFYFFGQLSVPLAFGTDKAEAGVLSNKENFTSIGVSVKPGIEYFFNKNWTLEATIGDFGYSNFKYKNAKSIDNYNFGLDLASVGIGVKYVFAKSK
jgi:hypothetical protein